MKAVGVLWRLALACVGRILLLASASLAPALVAAHETLPAALRIDAVSPAVFAVQWRLPATQGPAPVMQPVFPSDCVQMGTRQENAIPGAQIARWTIQCPSGLLDKTLRIAGQENYLLDTVVRLSLRDGTVVSRVARARSPSVQFESAAATAGSDTGGFFLLGVEHILGGIDHLLFVFCLLLWVRGFWPLLRTITGFTVGHSVTLSLATLGWVQLPGPPIEACIALSIVFLASTLARRRQLQGAAASDRRPWLVAMAFGLLHGFGFASALAQVGLPTQGLALALLNFNLGVEAGQLLFVAVVLAVLHLLRQLAAGRRWTAWRSARASAGVEGWEHWAAYGAGCVSVFWLLQRLALVVGAPMG